MADDDDIGRRLREAALRPHDEAFTRRVLAALPPRFRTGRHGIWHRSFLLASRVGLGLALLVAAHRGIAMAEGDAGTLLAMILFAVPTVAALARVCGPWFPRSMNRLLRRD